MMIEDTFYPLRKQQQTAREVGSWIDALAEKLPSLNNSQLNDKLGEVKTNYELMLQYLSQGYEDPQRDKLYEGLLADLDELTANAEHALYNHTNPTYIQAAHQAALLPFKRDHLQTALEQYVTDVAMLSLESEAVREAKSKQLYATHFDLLRNVFDLLLTSPQWHAEEEKFYVDLILSPTIDTMDAQVMVSAIMLSCVNIFDIAKHQSLATIYLKSSDERIRQRALVGWAFTVTPEMSFYVARQRQIAVRMSATDQDSKQLVTLQKQILLCTNAQKDNNKIRQDIIPNLLKNNNLDITRFGIVEKEDDPMQDILHPDAADKAMEDIEKSIRQMADMEKAGADIYFGGFQHMKRFPFFYKLINWFIPFFAEHPELKAPHLQGSKFLQRLFEKGPFCDSDKYSFALAMNNVIDQLPPKIREMMDSDEAVMGPSGEVDASSPTYIRRMVLQDLYRFFYLYPNKSDFNNPFLAVDSPDKLRIFLSFSSVFDTVKVMEHALEVASFVYSNDKTYLDEVNALLAAYPHTDAAECQLLKGIVNEDAHPEQARALFKAVLAQKPDTKRALEELAKVDIRLDKLSEARDCYEKLLQLQPDDLSTGLKLNIVRTSLGETDTAVGELYKLNYEHPESLVVMRALAWALLNQQSYDLAAKVYRKLLTGKRQIAEDYLNAGYALWLQGKRVEALTLFGKYDARGHALADAFHNDRDFLKAQQISESTQKLIVDVVKRQGKGH